MSYYCLGKDVPTFTGHGVADLQLSFLTYLPWLVWDGGEGEFVSRVQGTKWFWSVIHK